MIELKHFNSQKIYFHLCSDNIHSRATVHQHCNHSQEQWINDDYKLSTKEPALQNRAALIATAQLFQSDCVQH